MERRTTKRLIYGSLYISILLVIILAMYFLFLRPIATCFDGKQNQNEEGIDCGGVCMPCDVKYAQEFNVLQTQKFSAGSGKTILLAEIKNPNMNIGAIDFSYRFSIYDSQDRLLNEAIDRSFIYAGEIKYLIKIVDVDINNILRFAFDSGNFKWESKETFRKPAVAVKEFKTSIHDSGDYPLPIYIFVKDLSVGAKGEDVAKLQEFLKAENFYNSQITDVFDAGVKTALANYQKANNLSPAEGYFGGLTRVFVNEKIENYKKMLSETAEIYPVAVSGIVRNNDVVPASKVVIVGFLYNNFGVIISVSKTEIDKISPTDEKSFKIVFPPNIDPQSININATKIYIDSIR